MSSLQKMAWRNLGRNRKRSATTGLGLALAMSLCMATLGIMEGLSRDLIRGTTEGEVGHVQIHHPAYPDARQLRQTLPAGPALMAQLQQQDGVQAASARMFAYAYLSHGSRSSGVQLMGIDPVQERQVTTMHLQARQGRYLDDEASPWPQARSLSVEQEAQDRALTEAAIAAAFDEGKPAPLQENERAARNAALAEQLAPRPTRTPGVVLGAQLAANLGLDPQGQDTEVQVLYETSQGLQGSMALHVRGTTRSGLDHQDRSRVLLHLQDLQHMLQLAGRAHEIALRLHDPSQADAVAARLQALPMEGEAHKVQSWSQLRPDVLALIAANRALMGTLVFIVFLIAGVGVLNTMLVSITERQRELSLLKALGLSPLHLVLLVAMETLLLCLAACTLGLLVGAGLTAWLQIQGLDVSRFGSFSMSGVDMAPKLRAQLQWQTALVPLACMLLVSLLAALVPAVLAARLTPATGLRAT